MRDCQDDARGETQFYIIFRIKTKNREAFFMERIRAKDVQKSNDKITDILKALLVSYVITGGLLLLLSLLLYKFSFA